MEAVGNGCGVVEVRVLVLLLQNLLDPVRPGLGLSGLRLGENERTVEFGELLLIEQSTACIDDIVLGLIIDFGAVCVSAVVEVGAPESSCVCCILFSSA